MNEETTPVLIKKQVYVVYDDSNVRDHQVKPFQWF